MAKLAKRRKMQFARPVKTELWKRQEDAGAMLFLRCSVEVAAARKIERQRSTDGSIIRVAWHPLSEV